MNRAAHVVFILALLGAWLLPAGAPVAAAQAADPASILLSVDDLEPGFSWFLDTNSTLAPGIDLHLVGFVRDPFEDPDRPFMVLSELIVSDRALPPDALDGAAEGLERGLGAGATVSPVEGPEIGDVSLWLTGELPMGGDSLELLVLVYQTDRYVVLVAMGGLPGTVDQDEVLDFGALMQDRLP